MNQANTIATKLSQGIDPKGELKRPQLCCNPAARQNGLLASQLFVVSGFAAEMLTQIRSSNISVCAHYSVAPAHHGDRLSGRFAYPAVMSRADPFSCVEDVARVGANG